jgi:hypothetical protein
MITVRIDSEYAWRVPVDLQNLKRRGISSHHWTEYQDHEETHYNITEYYEENEEQIAGAMDELPTARVGIL